MPGTKFLPALAAIFVLGACGTENGEAEPAVESETRSLATVVAANEEFELVSEAMSDAGLSQIFDGAAYYTLLAPTDGAIEAIGENGAAVDDVDQRAALLAIMRNHILPGYVTSEDIAAAIENGGGSARIQTMGEDAVTFTMAGEDIRIAGEDGSSALFEGGEVRAANGVLLPVDGLLKQL